jgi:hypothetical protein
MFAVSRVGPGTHSMSWRAVQIVLEHSQARGVARLVLIAIAERMRTPGSAAWPAFPDIMRRTGVSRRSVVRALATLERQGELSVERHRGRPNHYRLRLGDQCQNGTRATTAPVPPWHGSGATVALQQCHPGTRTSQGTQNEPETRLHSRRRAAPTVVPTRSRGTGR